MKRLTTATHRPMLLLAAVPLLALACTDQAPTPLEAPDASADVGIEAAPVEGSLSVAVMYPFNTCNNNATQTDSDSDGDSDDWTLSVDANIDPCIEVTVTDGFAVTQGTVFFQVCELRGGGIAALESLICETGEGDQLGNWRTYNKVPVDNQGVAVSGGFSPLTGRPDGYRVLYKAQGSGLQNIEGEGFDIDNLIK